MITCLFCSKEIPTEPQAVGSGRILTKYRQDKDGVTVGYFCDAQCSLDLYQIEQTIINLVGDDCPKLKN